MSGNPQGQRTVPGSSQQGQRTVPSIGVNAPSTSNIRPVEYQKQRYEVYPSDGPINRSGRRVGWWTFVATEEMSVGQVEDTINRMRAQNRDIANDRRNNNLPVAFHKGAVGFVWVKEMSWFAQAGRLSPNLKVTIHLYRPQLAGWVNYASGQAQSSKLYLGVPADQPIVPVGIVKEVSFGNVMSGRSSDFAKLFDTVLHLIGHTEFSDTVRLEYSLKDMLKNEQSRTELVDGIIQASRTAGSWHIFQNECPSAERMWNDMKEYVVDRNASKVDEIYGIRWRALIPRGTRFNGDVMTFRNGRVVEGASVLGIADDTFKDDTFIYYAYGGATIEIASRHQSHRMAIDGEAYLRSRHYTITRFLKDNLQGEWRMFRLLTLNSRSDLCKTTNGRRLAEQLMISWFFSWNPLLLQAAEHPTMEQLSDGHFMASVAANYAIANALEQCFQEAVRQTGLSRFAHSKKDKGLNWNGELARRDFYARPTFSRFSVFDDDGYFLKHLYVRPTLARAYKTNSDQTRDKPLIIINAGPGRIRFTLPVLPVHCGVKEGQRFYVTYEVHAPGRESHPLPMSEVPSPGPLSDWDEVLRIGLQIQWESEGEWYTMYPKLYTKSKVVDARNIDQDQEESIPGQSAVSQALRKTLCQYDKPMAVLASLERHQFPHNSSPEYLNIIKSVVHDFQFDFLRRVVSCTRVGFKQVPQATVVGGEGVGSMSRAVEINIAKMETLIPPESIGQLPVAHPTRRNTQPFARCDLCSEKSTSDYHCVIYDLQLSDGREVKVCDLCQTLRRCCTKNTETTVNTIRGRKFVGRYKTREPQPSGAAPTLLDFMDDIEATED